MRILIKPHAESDMLAAQTWYNEAVPGLGKRFRAEVANRIRALAEHPESATVVYESFRRAVMRKFPYCIYYGVEDDTLVVFAVVSSHRHPDAWKSSIQA